jgi:hypothetical protein
MIANLIVGLIFMMRRSLVIIVVLIATDAFCFGDVSLFIESHWNTFSNISRFQEFYSTTNLPSEVRSNILEYHAEINILEYQDEINAEMHMPEKKGDTGEALTPDSFRLVWAATDGTNYAVHWEIVPGPTLPDLLAAENWSENCITAAIRETGGTNFIISTGSCYDLYDHLDDYKKFVDYEIAEARLELFEEIGQ